MHDVTRRQPAVMSCCAPRAAWLNKSARTASQFAQLLAVNPQPTAAPKIEASFVLLRPFLSCFDWVIAYALLGITSDGTVFQQSLWRID